MVRGAIPADKLAALNALYDERLAALPADDESRERGAYLGKDRDTAVKDRFGRYYIGASMWGESYTWLIDNPAVAPILAETLSDPVWGHCPEVIPEDKRPLWRLDHDNCHYKMPADGSTDAGGGLHGVPDGFHVTAVYELCDINVGDGGCPPPLPPPPQSHPAHVQSPARPALTSVAAALLHAVGCIPGSQNHDFNERVVAMEKGWNTSWVDTPWTSKLSSWPEDIPVHRVVDEVGGIAAGDCTPPQHRMLWRALSWL